MRGLTLPFSIEGDHLVVRGRYGDTSRLPLTGDGAVAALAPYRYSTSTSSEESGQGIQTWWRVGGSGRGQPPPGHSALTDTGDQTAISVPAQAGFHVGGWQRWSFDLSVEWGVAALDRNGEVLLRMRPLRNLAQVRRFAQACGLAFVEEQMTDPARLGRAPELITGTDALLGKGTRKAIDVVGFVLAAVVGLVVYAALAQGGVGGVMAVLPAVVAFLACRSLFGWLLRRFGAWVVARSRG